jgi:hypothetical protein
VQKFKYTGDDPVDVPALGLVDVTKGTHIEVNDPELAAGTARAAAVGAHPGSGAVEGRQEGSRLAR